MAINGFGFPQGMNAGYFNGGYNYPRGNYNYPNRGFQNYGGGFGYPAGGGFGYPNAGGFGYQGGGYMPHNDPDFMRLLNYSVGGAMGGYFPGPARNLAGMLAGDMNPVGLSPVFQASNQGGYGFGDMLGRFGNVNGGYYG
ncbi:MAG TPA: hypothetical protein V6C52_06955 [Coleofasciculaceae cyanobacterium]|jgi:hypothetical protein